MGAITGALVGGAAAAIGGKLIDQFIGGPEMPGYARMSKAERALLRLAKERGELGLEQDVMSLDFRRAVMPGLQEQVLRALRGETITPEMEKSLSMNRRELHDMLLSKGISPGSTAYINAMEKIYSSQALSRHEINLRSLRPGLAFGAPPVGGEGVGAPLAALAGQRSGQFQAAVTGYGAQMGAASDLMQIGTMLGYEYGSGKDRRVV